MPLFQGKVRDGLDGQRPRLVGLNLTLMSLGKMARAWQRQVGWSETVKVIGFLDSQSKSGLPRASRWSSRACAREGLRLVKERGLHNVEVEMDADVVVKIFNNSAINGHEANTLLLDCKKLLDDDDTFLGLSHTLIEGNKFANFLANQGHGSTWGTTTLERPPEALENTLRLDAAGAVSQRITIQAV